MHRIFPNLYRFDFGPKGASKVTSHCYLLVRKAGNLLMCHAKAGASVLDYANEIDRLGGIDLQFVPHFHDANRGPLHQALYDRFGCKLAYHQAERRSIRTKTKCPEEEFGDEGLKLGSDFEAHRFPGHTPGMSVYTWKHRGRRFLFPSHVFDMEDGKWIIDFAPHLAPQQKPRLLELAKLDIDVWVRGRSSDVWEEHHVLTASEKRAFRKTLRERITPKPRKSGRPLVVTGYLPCLKMLAQTKQFDIQAVLAFHTCPIEGIVSQLAGANVLLIVNCPRSLKPENEFLASLRDFVEKGGGLLIGESRPQTNRNRIIHSHPFPELVEGAASTSGMLGQELATEKKHPALGSLKNRPRFSTEAAVGVALQPGPKGTVLLRNRHGEAVCVGGKVGKGRVIFTGFYHGRNIEYADEERRALPATVSWLAGKG